LFHHKEDRAGKQQEIMPKGFTDCVSGGGRVRTITGPNKTYGLKAGQYCHVCFDKSGMHKGEKHIKKN
jgi:hypothetical protein